MVVLQFAGQGKWNGVLRDQLTKKEIEEKKHILKEGKDAEEEFRRKHL